MRGNATSREFGVSSRSREFGITSRAEEFSTFSMGASLTPSRPLRELGATFSGRPFTRSQLGTPLSSKEEKEKKLADSLQVLRTRAEPPPLQAFGIVVPRAPSSHRPRLKAFGEIISPRILDGVGGYVGQPKSVAATHQYASEPKKAAQKSQSSSSFGGTAASATPFLEEKAPEAGVVIKSKKNGGREELSFKRSGWRPARIDVSEAGIQSYSKQESEDQTRKDLRFVFDMLDSSTNDGIITEQDLSRQFRRLHYAPEEGEVKGIIWEVDDDNDGGINWREFVNLYKRVKDDEVGIEPRRFYTLIVFLTFDLDADGLVSLNDALELVYRRKGKKALLQKNGARSNLNLPAYGDTLSFSEYVKFDFNFYTLTRQLADQRREKKQKNEADCESSFASARFRVKVSRDSNPMRALRQRSGLRAGASFRPNVMANMTTRRTLSVLTPGRKKSNGSMLKSSDPMAQMQALQSFASSPRAQNSNVITHGITTMVAESRPRRGPKLSAREGLRRQQVLIGTGNRPRRGSEVRFWLLAAHTGPLEEDLVHSHIEVCDSR